ncbi:MAG: thiopurine S-methyltransferase [Candidatus Eremiobacteraeota bacterium]|nr:thiopurine S-methyltransferase [Candidatus Eremiobacteraeota bacterium]
MEHEFWHTRWEKREISFHEGEPNSFLVKHFPCLGLEKGARVFLPLCGKTRDIAWLLEQGCRVAGVELNETAVEELFDELGLHPEVEEADEHLHYSAAGLDVYLGDVFDLSSGLLGPVDAVYDRAALVALPSQTRPLYTAHLQDVTSRAPQLVITFQYDQSQMEGPPFSIPYAELERHYDEAFHIEQLESRLVEGTLKGKVEATESICHLRRRL